MSGKSAIVCEVCKGRVRHDGKSIRVGMRRTGRKRMVCGNTSCLREWRRLHPKQKEQDMGTRARITDDGLELLHAQVWNPNTGRKFGWATKLAKKMAEQHPAKFPVTQGGILQAITRILKDGPPKVQETPPMPVVNREMGHGMIPPGSAVEEAPVPKHEAILEAMRGSQGIATYDAGSRCYAIARVIRASVNYLAEVGDMETLKALAALSTEAVVK